VTKLVLVGPSLASEKRPTESENITSSSLVGMGWKCRKSRYRRLVKQVGLDHEQALDYGVFVLPVTNLVTV